MPAPSVFFGGSISQNYEDYLGAFLFEPYAADLAGRIRFDDIQRILELACGSGRLTRHIAESLPHTVSLTATDLSEDMIAVAKGKLSDDRITWAVADMQNQPFENGSFDVVVCQFSLMLVPDQARALSEIFRVLRPGGKLLFSTWTDLAYNRLWAIGDRVIKEALGKSPLLQDPGPFALDDAIAVQQLLSKTGFSGIRVATVTNTGEIESAEKAAYGLIYGLPVSLFIQKHQPEALPVILRTLQHQLAAGLGDHPLRTPQKALVFEAAK